MNNFSRVSSASWTSPSLEAGCQCTTRHVHTYNLSSLNKINRQVRWCKLGSNRRVTSTCMNAMQLLWLRETNLWDVSENSIVYSFIVDVSYSSLTEVPDARFTSSRNIYANVLEILSADFWEADWFVEVFQRMEAFFSVNTGWGWKFGTTKCTADISEVRNHEY